MDNERLVRSFLQAYRWMIAGLSGAAISTVQRLELSISGFGFQMGILLLILVLAVSVEYVILGSDPDYED